MGYIRKLAVLWVYYGNKILARRKSAYESFLDRCMQVQQQPQQQQGGIGGVEGGCGGSIAMPSQLMAHLHPTHTHHLHGQVHHKCVRV